MPLFLTFALVAPMASFGAIAIGERRSGWDRPARSAILGLVAACLGIQREDDVAHAALASGYGLALLCHAPGRLLADYHTTQVPPSRKGRRFATRAAELAVSKDELSTILSRRDYRTGAWHLGALWQRNDQSPWPLPALAEAMRQPVFVPYLGRKSCPLGLPLAPAINEAQDAAAALLARHDTGPEGTLLDYGNQPVRERLADPVTPPTIVLDAADIDANDPRHRRTEIRRDQPRSRQRWQFDLRQEAVLTANPP